MSLFETISNLFKNNKKNAHIIVDDLTKKYGEDTPLEVALYEDNAPLVNKNVSIKINNVTYSRTTDENGIAKLNINLRAGKYLALISFTDSEYNKVTAYSIITIQSNTRMEGTDINMTYKDGTYYQCAVYDDAGRIAGDVNLTINGKTYRRTADSTGLYKLNINLSPGTYKILAEYLGDDIHLPSNVINTINVREAKKQEPAPAIVKLYSYITQQGGGKLGQKTGYTCGPHSLMQAIYRLTGIELSEMELASICGSTSSGTSHSGLETGLAWFNRKYGYNLKMTWKNFSEVGFAGLQKAYENGAVFLHLCYRSTWGHYEVPLTSSTDPNKILNSLGNNCGNGYCGYIESRSRSTQQSYINGISQKSVCIITR